MLKKNFKTSELKNSFKSLEEYHKLNSEKLSDDQGKCNGCNGCCSIMTPISAEELKILKRKINKKILKEYLNSFYKGEINSICPFFSFKERKCSVYNLRPQICKEYHCDFKYLKVSPFRIPDKKYLMLDVLPPELNNIKILIKNLAKNVLGYDDIVLKKDEKLNLDFDNFALKRIDKS